MKILIDNGHGIDTPGKRSPDGRLLEWEWSRDVAKRLHIRLKELGIDAHRIVPEDIDVPLNQRVRRVNDICRVLGSNNCILISIHVNAAGYGKWCTARGWSVFVSQNASQNSRRLAAMFYGEAAKRNLKGNRCVPTEHYWVQSLAMCRDTKCPAVLTENMFMDNPQDVEFLLSEAGKNEIVDLHVAGIRKYLASL